MLFRKNKRPEEAASRPQKKRFRNVLFWLTVIAVLLIVPGLYNGLAVRYYTIEAEAITQPVRIALITDLHSCKYGDREEALIEAIDEQSPDIIALSGDILDDEIPDTNTEYLLQGIAGKYPCYYVTGNHEYLNGKQDFAEKMALLEKYNVHILSGTLEAVTVNGETIAICGVDDPKARSLDSAASFSGQFESVRKQAEQQVFTILLSHRPEYYELYAQSGFDLVLCGHAHGGQWRIPGILNGLYAPDQGLFPGHAGGLYQMEDTTMIVSRGLARESTRIPRFYNRPELVIVDLQ